MPSPYSLTIQISYDNAWNPATSHLAVVVNTPFGQTYAGFGPADHRFSAILGSWSRGQYDVQVVQPGEPLISTDYSTVLGHSNLAAFTLPGTESQVITTLIWIQGREMASILDQVGVEYGATRIGPNYNAWSSVVGAPYVCTTDVTAC